MPWAYLSLKYEELEKRRKLRSDLRKRKPVKMVEKGLIPIVELTASLKSFSISKTIRNGRKDALEQHSFLIQILVFFHANALMLQVNALGLPKTFGTLQKRATHILYSKNLLIDFFSDGARPIRLTSQSFPFFQILFKNSFQARHTQQCGLYGQPPCTFIPSPSGVTPICATPGKTYCETIHNYPM